MYVKSYKKNFWNVRLCIYSVGIESAVNDDKSSLGQSDALCYACKMAVVWMQNEFSQKQTVESILNYTNQVM